MKLIYIAISLFMALTVNASQVEIEVGNGNSVIQAQGNYSHNFGMVRVNSRSVASFSLRNTGVAPLTYKEAYIYGGDFMANHSCANGLQPNEVCTFSITYWPMFEGMSSGRFVLSFAEENIIFDLWGQARRM